MKNPNYLIQIAEPCHEDWNAMLPDAKGKFCNSCSKSVVDFSGKTDQEIHTILMEKKGEKVCGHFKASQVNRPLSIRIDFNDLPENMSTTKTFTLALLLVFGSMLFSFTDLKGQHIKNVQVKDTEKVMHLKGKIKCEPVKEEKLPVPPDSILIDISEMPVMGGIHYVEPEVQDTAALQRTIEQEEELMGDTILIEDEACSNTTAPQLIEQPRISESLPEFIIYPNPAHGDFTIRYDVLKRSDVNIQMLDQKGAIVKTLVDTIQQYEGKYHIPVNTNDLLPGTYIIVSTMEGKRYTERVIVER